MLALFNLTLLVIVTICFRYNKGFLFAPELIYNIFFLLAGLNWATNTKYWENSLYLSTYLMIISGSLIFILGCIAGRSILVIFNHGIVPSKGGIARATDYEKSVNIEILYYVSIATVLLAIIGSRRYLAQLSDLFSQDGSITSGSALYNTMNKKTGENTLAIPRWVNLSRRLSFVFAYLNTYFFTRNIFSRDRNIETLAIIQLLLTYYLSLLFGARQMFIRLIFILLTMIFFFGWKKSPLLSGKAKSIIGFVVFLAVAISVFYFLAIRIGRTDKALDDPYYYLSIYIGAPLKNFNDWFNGKLMNPVYATSQFWGQQTFAKLWNRTLGLNANQIAMQWNAWQPYQSMYGRSLGNVYTQYYTLIFDWGITGALIVTFLIGFFSRMIYELAWNEIDSKNMHVSLLIYGNITYGLAFSYFLNFLFTNLFTVDFFEQIVLAVLLWKIICIVSSKQSSSRETIQRSTYHAGLDSIGGNQ